MGKSIGTHRGRDDVHVKVMSILNLWIGVGAAIQMALGSGHRMLGSRELPMEDLHGCYCQLSHLFWSKVTEGILWASPWWEVFSADYSGSIMVKGGRVEVICWG